MHIEKKSLVNNKVAAATNFAFHSRRVDLSKPAASRVLTLKPLNVMAMASSGKHIKQVTIEMMRPTPPPPPPPPPPS